MKRFHIYVAITCFLIAVMPLCRSQDTCVNVKQVSIKDSLFVKCMDSVLHYAQLCPYYEDWPIVVIVERDLWSVGKGYISFRTEAFSDDAFLFLMEFVYRESLYMTIYKNVMFLITFEDTALLSFEGVVPYVLYPNEYCSYKYLWREGVTIPIFSVEIYTDKTYRFVRRNKCESIDDMYLFDGSEYHMIYAPNKNDSGGNSQCE